MREEIISLTGKGLSNPDGRSGGGFGPEYGDKERTHMARAK